MRAVLIPALPAMLAACTATQPSQDDLRPRQEAACTATIAAHVGRPSSEVTSRWLSETGGIAQIEARDGNRLHVCQVDASGRVLGYIHPGY
ncbi:hypothetical protein RGQ15_15420 [Paracoccus sp. MBLB3053]|uniref:PepSY domain-containing protein n=1 Tax=Paracoccus aurantius TaxID=3073814 RepID=A0ABU2HV85_9RHOB|nr:hypothetical protein [Paracoccus sp. MBLB3053]MDS9468956.1 hypothetical protein [Paracoccus sp. MBLB3053]